MSTTYSYEKLDQPEALKHIFQTKSSSDPAPDSGTDLMIDTADDCTLQLRAFPSEMKDKPVILFFHDQNEEVNDYNEIAAQYIKNMGTSFLIAGYRGYGQATGSPSVTTMMTDCQALFEKALQWKNDNNFTGKFICMGLGLGCVSAIEVVFNNPSKTDALLVDSGFTFSIPVLTAMGVDVKALNLTEDDGFHNLEKIRKIEKPLYVIHMAKDDFIHMDNASNLVSESLGKQKELQIVPGKADDNQSILEVTGNMYFEVMNRFVKMIGIVRKKKVGVR